MAPSLDVLTAKDLEWLFRHREGTADLSQERPDLDVATMSRHFQAPRFRVRYRMWHLDPTQAMWNLWCPLLRDQLERRDGRVEVVEMPHQYLRLTSLVGVA